MYTPIEAYTIVHNIPLHQQIKVHVQYTKNKHTDVYTSNTEIMVLCKRASSTICKTWHYCSESSTLLHHLLLQLPLAQLSAGG